MFYPRKSIFRKEGKVKSKYLSPVAPGKIADIERVQTNIDQLSKEIRELEWNIESLEKMLACCKKREKKKEVIISRFSENPGKQLFAEKKMTRYQIGKILEMRCWERERADIHEILNHLGLTEYNPYEIVRKTHGVSYNDFIWFRFPGENLTSKDVLVR